GVVGLTVPPPEATPNVTATPPTGLPCVSRTITEGSTATAVPVVAAWPLPALMAIELAAPAVPVAVNVTGLPVSPLDVAVSVFGPAVGPRVHEVMAAIPLAFVLTGAVGLTVPPPEATANVTRTPATEFPFASRTITDGSTATAVPAVAVWPLPALIAICVAAPAVAVAVKVTGDPAPVVCTVWVPAWAPSVQVVAAIPLALLVDVGGVTAPLPLAGVQVTVTPATGLL